jgi:hypothetical protein
VDRGCAGTAAWGIGATICCVFGKYNYRPTRGAATTRDEDVEHLCSSFGVDLRDSGNHAPREVVNGWPVAIGPHKIPMSVSWAGLVVAALLALWGVGQIG